VRNYFNVWFWDNHAGDAGWSATKSEALERAGEGIVERFHANQGNKNMALDYLNAIEGFILDGNPMSPTEIPNYFFEFTGR